MALSNWDTLAIGNNGKGCNGEVKGKNASLEIYKNWAYVHSEKMWVEGSSYVKPVIAQIEEGRISIGGLHIYATRHSLQNSIFVFVSQYIYNEKTQKTKLVFFAGIGCYGYYSKVEEYMKWKGINVEYADYTTGSRNYRIDEKGETIPLDKFVDTIIFYDKDDNHICEIEVDEAFGELTDFVGVMPETLKAFKNWIETEVSEEYKYQNDFKKWLKKINWDELTRYNQGDAYFVGSDQASTPVGKQESETILTKALK